MTKSTGYASLVNRFFYDNDVEMKRAAGLAALSCFVVRRSLRVRVNAGLSRVAEHRLHGIRFRAERIVLDVLPSADVADLAIRVVVPAARGLGSVTDSPCS